MGGVKGVVLAGGQGKRLRPLSYYFQKCMIPIGHMQKPLLEYIVRLLRHHGIDELSILVGYKHEQITNYFNSGERFNVRIAYTLDRPELKGTGGSLLNAYQQGAFGPDDVLIVYYGDILSNVDLTQMLAQHRARGAAATLALTHGYQVRVGVASVERGAVTDWTEKPTIPITAGIGVLVLNASVMPALEGLRDRHQELDIMSHLVPRLIANKAGVHAYLTDAFWYDVGSTERYEKLDNHAIEEHLDHYFEGDD